MRGLDALDFAALEALQRAAQFEAAQLEVHYHETDDTWSARLFELANPSRLEPDGTVTPGALEVSTKERSTLAIACCDCLEIWIAAATARGVKIRQQLRAIATGLRSLVDNPPPELQPRVLLADVCDIAREALRAEVVSRERLTELLDAERRLGEMEAKATVEKKGRLYQ